MKWIPGKTDYIADALSLASLFSPAEMPNLDIHTAITCRTYTQDPALVAFFLILDLHSLYVLITGVDPLYMKNLLQIQLLLSSSA